MKTTIYETSLSHAFNDIFSGYQIRSVINKSQGGWPDRMLQLNNSRVCFAELKVVEVRKDGFFKLGLRQDQAAWLAKWQLHQGLCFVMFIDNYFKEDRKFGILTYEDWKNWLRVPDVDYCWNKPVIIIKDYIDILMWFTKFISGSK